MADQRQSGNKQSGGNEDDEGGKQGGGAKKEGGQQNGGKKSSGGKHGKTSRFKGGAPERRSFQYRHTRAICEGVWMREGIEGY